MNTQSNTQPSLEQDILETAWIRDKICESDVYAQNLYAAMCNHGFQKQAVMPILTDQYWTCSWRYAGGIIARVRNQGDYMDWYCSGIGTQADHPGYVQEEIITDEIREDLERLGWIILADY